ATPARARSLPCGVVSGKGFRRRYPDVHPDRQMVGGKRGGREAVDPGGDEVKPGGKRHAVERADRPWRGKARARRMEPERGPEGVGPAMRGPVVEIAQERGRPVAAPADRGADRGELHPAVAADQPEVHADDPETPVLGPELGQDGAARLEP